MALAFAAMASSRDVDLPSATITRPYLEQARDLHHAALSAGHAAATCACAMLEVLRQHARVHADVSGFLVTPKENIPSKASPHGASAEDWKIFMGFAMKLSKEPKKRGESHKVRDVHEVHEEGEEGAKSKKDGKQDQEGHEVCDDHEVREEGEQGAKGKKEGKHNRPGRT